jgi:hypothetical protein
MEPRRVSGSGAGRGQKTLGQLPDRYWASGRQFSRGADATSIPPTLGATRTEFWVRRLRQSVGCRIWHLKYLRRNFIKPQNTFESLSPKLRTHLKKNKIRKSYLFTGTLENVGLILKCLFGYSLAPGNNGTNLRACTTLSMTHT